MTGKAQRQRPGEGGGGAANLSEQSLTSDSILFYLSGQQRESMAEATAATMASASSSSPMGAAGRFSAADGAEAAAALKSRGSGIPAASRLGFTRESSEAYGGGGERGYNGWEDESAANGAGGLRGATASSPQPARSARRGEHSDQGQMSPLTRLLAETPVRLRAPGDLRPNRGDDPTGEQTLLRYSCLP